MVTAAAAQFLFASALSPTWLSPVVRVRLRPPTLTVVVPRTTVIPVAFEVIVTVQEPVVPTVVHVGEPTNEPGPDWMPAVMLVPAGAFTKPVPGLTLTWRVRTWLVPIGLFALAGVIPMFASTKVLTALPLFGEVPSVWTVKLTPPTLSM